MEQIIGLLLIGGSLYVLVTLHNDAREQEWSRIARAVLYGSGIAVMVLAILIALGSTQAAQLMFVGIGTVLVVILLLFGALMLALGLVALRDRHQNPDRGPDDSDDHDT